MLSMHFPISLVTVHLAHARNRGNQLGRGINKTTNLSEIIGKLLVDGRFYLFFLDLNALYVGNLFPVDCFVFGHIFCASL